MPGPIANRISVARLWLGNACPVLAEEPASPWCSERLTQDPITLHTKHTGRSIPSMGWTNRARRITQQWQGDTRHCAFANKSEHLHRQQQHHLHLLRHRRAPTPLLSTHRLNLRLNRQRPRSRLLQAQQAQEPKTKTPRRQPPQKSHHRRQRRARERKRRQHHELRDPIVHTFRLPSTATDAGSELGRAGNPAQQPRAVHERTWERRRRDDPAAVSGCNSPVTTTTITTAAAGLGIRQDAKTVAISPRQAPFATCLAVSSAYGIHHPRETARPNARTITALLLEASQQSTATALPFPLHRILFTDNCHHERGATGLDDKNGRHDRAESAGPEGSG